MIIGFLTFMSGYNKNKYTKDIFLAIQLVYCISKADFKNLFAFSLINILLLTLIPLLVRKTRKANGITSVLSILVYSISIDIICYYLYPMFNDGSNILQYIWSGITFNLKGILIPSISAVLYIFSMKGYVKVYENMLNRC